MNKLLATLIAGFLAAGAFAQTAPATPAKPAAPAVAAAPAAPAVAAAPAAPAKAEMKAAKEVKKDGKPEVKAEVAKADKPATVTK